MNGSCSSSEGATASSRRTVRESKREGRCGAPSLLSVLPGRLAVLAAATFLMVPLRAHDFWIEPSTYRPAPSEQVALELRVGEHFAGDRLAIRPARIERFFVHRDASEAAIGAAGLVKAADSGATIVAYHSRPGRSVLAAAKFEAYLREEGLESIIAERAERGESNRAGREIFSRCAKSVLGGDDRPIGLRLEIVRRANEVAVTFEGKPLANALVVAMRQGSSAAPLRARTGADGVAVFPEFPRGVWLAKAVHMVRALPASPDADWESVWASATFEVR